MDIIFFKVGKSELDSQNFGKIALGLNVVYPFLFCFSFLFLKGAPGEVKESKGFTCCSRPQHAGWGKNTIAIIMTVLIAMALVIIIIKNC